MPFQHVTGDFQCKYLGFGVTCCIPGILQLTNTLCLLCIPAHQHWLKAVMILLSVHGKPEVQHIKAGAWCLVSRVCFAYLLLQ